MIAVSESLNKNIKHIEETRLVIEKIFEPYLTTIVTVNKQTKPARDSFKKISEQTKSLKGAATSKQVESFKSTADLINKQLEPLRKTNQKLAKQIDIIINPLKIFESISDSLIIPNFIDSYNSTKELINNFKEYDTIKNEEQLLALKKAKENYNFSNNIESKIRDLSNDEEGILQSYLKDIYTVITKKLNNEDVIAETSVLLSINHIAKDLEHIIPELEAYLILLNVFVIILKSKPND